MPPTSKASAEHYTWGGRCDGWRLLAAGALAVIEERMPPGATEVAHRHRAARQFFYVLKGELSMEVEGAVERIPERHGLEIAPGAAHRAFNQGPEPVEFLVISSPPTQGDRVDVA